jgi:phosphoribosylanthranilate isomerase
MMFDESGIFVKICGITTEGDALLAVGLGANAVGFVFAPSPRQIAHRVAGDIARRLPDGVASVAVFRDEAPSRVVEIVMEHGFSAVQLHGHETPDEVRYVAERVPLTIKAFVAGDPAVARFDEFGAPYLMLDGAAPGSGAVFDWTLAGNVPTGSRLIISGGLKPSNVRAAIDRLHPFGVDVSSGVESAPGRKNPALLSAFIHAARSAVPFDEGERDDQQRGSGPYDWME